MVLPSIIDSEDKPTAAGTLIEDESLKNYYSSFPSESHLRELLEDAFVIIKPMDGVGGDGYWIHEKDGRVFLVVFDCSGHGRFASMMTRKYIEVLNEIIVVQGRTDPGQILNQVHQTICREFEGRKNLKVGTGADMAVVCIDYNHPIRQCYFSGAKIKLIHDLEKKLCHEEALRMPVGEYFEFDREYKSKVIMLPEDRKCHFFLFTDGVTDLIGGERDKKLGFKNLITILQEVAGMSSPKQKSHVLKELTKWMGPNEPLDDLLITGFSV